MSDQLTPAEIAFLEDSIDAQYRQIQATNPIRAAAYLQRHEGAIVNARGRQVAGAAVALQRAPQPDVLQTRRIGELLGGMPVRRGVT